MCADCKQILSILVRMAKESAFKKSLQKYLEDECTNLPLQTLIPQCQALVKDYYARLIASLEKKLDPSLICTQLGACPADLPGSQDGLMQLLRGLEWLLPQLQGQVSTLPSGHTQEAPGELLLPIPLPLCWLCRTFIGKAESVIPKVRHPRACQVSGCALGVLPSLLTCPIFPQATIGKAMSKLCYVLPGVVAGMCQCLMEKYTVIIVDALVSKLGPRLICGMMLMCASEENCGPGTKALSRLPLLPQGREPGAAGCSRGMSGVSPDQRPSGGIPQGKPHPEGSGGSLVKRLQPSFSSWPQCTHFIYQHQPKLSALLMQPWDSQTICQELGACTAEQLLPRATPCAQGPAYWCSSLSAAKQCEAIQHCQDHVWL
ncbi:hypothetical protein E2320_006798 [Naja naja]|nr:hypothetical protein E2320_006798 [Naja naja]